MSVTRERQLTCYPSPKYYIYAKAYAELNEMSSSKVGALALKRFFESMKPDELAKIERQAKIGESKKQKQSKNSC